MSSEYSLLNEVIKKKGCFTLFEYKIDESIKDFCRIKGINKILTQKIFSNGSFLMVFENSENSIHFIKKNFKSDKFEYSKSEKEDHDSMFLIEHDDNVYIIFRKIFKFSDNNPEEKIGNDISWLIKTNRDNEGKIDLDDPPYETITKYRIYNMNINFDLRVKGFSFRASKHVICEYTDFSYPYLLFTTGTDSLEMNPSFLISIEDHKIIYLKLDETCLIDDFDKKKRFYFNEDGTIDYYIIDENMMKVTKKKLKKGLKNTHIYEINDVSITRLINGSEEKNKKFIYLEKENILIYTCGKNVLYHTDLGDNKNELVSFLLGSKKEYELKDLKKITNEKFMLLINDDDGDQIFDKMVIFKYEKRFLYKSKKTEIDDTESFIPYERNQIAKRFDVTISIKGINGFSRSFEKFELRKLGMFFIEKLNHDTTELILDDFISELWLEFLWYMVYLKKKSFESFLKSIKDEELFKLYFQSLKYDIDVIHRTIIMHICNRIQIDGNRIIDYFDLPEYYDEKLCTNILEYLVINIDHMERQCKISWINKLQQEQNEKHHLFFLKNYFNYKKQTKTFSENLFFVNNQK